MTKDFFDIFKFLIAQLDPKLEIDGKMEDEVPVIMRRLKYPVEVNRSKLQSICGPNTWPQLLGVLDWLISLIQVNDTFIEPVALCTLGVAEDADCEADHHTLRALHENYLQFLQGKDDNSVEEHLRQVYQQRTDAVQSEIHRLQEQTSGMETQLQEFKSEHERLLEIQAAPQQLELEADQLRNTISLQDAQAQRMEEEAVGAEVEERTILSEVEDLEVKAKQLQEVVDSQQVSKNDIERLKCERKHLRRILEDLRADAEKADQGVWELGMEESGLEEDICRMVRCVNDRAEAVETDVPNAGGPCGEKLAVHVDLTDATDALAALEFNQLGERVQEAIAAHGEDTRREEATLHELQDAQRVVHDELLEKDRACRLLKERLEQLTRRREEYRVWSDSQLDDARRTVEASEDAVRAASIGSAAPSLRDSAEVDELRLRLNELTQRRDADRVSMEDKVRREQEAFNQHQQHIQKEMRMALEAVDKLREDVEKRVGERDTITNENTAPNNK
jgi:kinetochore protein NDC80